MFLILPVVFLSLYIHELGIKKDRFEALAATLVLFEVILLVMTNLFSVLHILNEYTVFAAWMLVFVSLILWHAIKKGLDMGEFYAACRTSVRIEGKVEKSVLFMLILIGALFLILFFGALFTVPYNYDSMTYHLGRIGYWIDNQSVNHYLTNIDRQIYSPVLAEYNILHANLLSGGDILANMPQYFSLLVTTLFIYKCARILGTDRNFSVLSALLFATMPLTISQSITTQNDLMGAMWFSIFLYYLIGFVKEKSITCNREQREKLFLAGASVAFGYLVKTSVSASMLMFIPWLLIVRIQKKDRFFNLVKAAGIAASTILVLISESLIRTWISCGKLIADTTSSDILVATSNMKYILVNILKNFSMLITQHLCRPLNGFVYRIAIHTGQRLGVEVNNEAIAFHGFDFINHMNMGDDMYSHDKTPSAVVAYLSVFAILLAFILLIRKVAARREKGTQLLFSPGFAISAWCSLGFIMALLRWQPWGTRLMYPALAMMAVMIGNVAYAVSARWKKAEILLLTLAVLSVLLSIRPLCYNLVPAKEYLEAGLDNRTEQYFRLHDQYKEYNQLVEQVKKSGYQDVGLSISGDGFDYPLWVMLRAECPQVRIRHIIPGQENAGDKAPDCILIIEKGAMALGDEVSYQGITYQTVYAGDGEYEDYYLEPAGQSR